MKKSFTIKGKGPKQRKPVAKKPNVAFKSKKDYRRKGKHVSIWGSVPEE
jgi:hypothetical protein